MSGLLVLPFLRPSPRAEDRLFGEASFRIIQDRLFIEKKLRLSAGGRESLRDRGCLKASWAVFTFKSKTQILRKTQVFRKKKTIDNFSIKRLTFLEMLSEVIVQINEIFHSIPWLVKLISPFKIQVSKLRFYITCLNVNTAHIWIQHIKTTLEDFSLGQWNVFSGHPICRSRTRLFFFILV